MSAAVSHTPLPGLVIPTGIVKARTTDPEPIALTPATVVPPADDTINPNDEIDLLIRARYPVLYIVSYEEARIEQQLAKIARIRGKTLYLWSISSGIRKAGTSPASGKTRTAQDPVEALNLVLEHKDPAIYLFHDLHAYLHTSCQGNRPVVRKLREVARALTDSYKTVVISSPTMDFSPDLSKDVTVVDFALPTKQDLEKLLIRIKEEVASNSNLKLELSPEETEQIVRAAGGLTLQEAENVLAKTIVNDGKLSGSDVSTIVAEKRQIIRKSGLLEFCDAAESLDDVGGMDLLKHWLDRRALAFSQKASEFGLPSPKGVLLVGVQGCGKSLCAKAISSAWKMPLLRFDVGRMFSSLVGSSEQNVRRAIAVAESVAPVVLWVDEIDKALSGAANSGAADGGTAARVMSTFLTWLSEKSSSVFVLATANDVTQLPPELMRKGRLDEIFFVDLPNVAERQTILQIHLRKRNRGLLPIDLSVVARAADGFSGAELEQVIISGLYEAFYQDRDLNTDDLLHSVSETVPMSRTMSERLAAIRGWAEGRARPSSTSDSPRDTAQVVTGRRLEL